MKIFGFEFFKKKPVTVPVAHFIGGHTDKPTTLTVKTTTGYNHPYTYNAVPTFRNQREEDDNNGVDLVTGLIVAETIFGNTDTVTGNFDTDIPTASFDGFSGGDSGGGGASGSWDSSDTVSDLSFDSGF